LYLPAALWQAPTLTGYNPVAATRPDHDSVMPAQAGIQKDSGPPTTWRRGMDALATGHPFAQRRDATQRCLLPALPLWG